MRDNLCFRQAVNELYSEVLDMNEVNSSDPTINAQTLSNRISKEFNFNYENLTASLFGTNAMNDVITHEYFQSWIKGLVCRVTPEVFGASEDQKMRSLFFDNYVTFKRLIFNSLAVELDCKGLFDSVLEKLMVSRVYLRAEEFAYSAAQLSEALQANPITDSLGLVAQRYFQLFSELSSASEPFQIIQKTSLLIKANQIFWHRLTPVGYSFLRDLAKAIFPIWVASRVLEKTLNSILMQPNLFIVDSKLNPEQTAFDFFTSFISLFRFKENEQSYINDLNTSGFNIQYVIALMNKAFVFGASSFLNKGYLTALPFISAFVE